jgi:four helix bundle protein
LNGALTSAIGIVTENAVRAKSYAFALAIVRFYRRSRGSHGGVIARQMLRCGTSIGANVEEALAGQSRRDFIAKMSIASKEARECHYWLRLTQDAADSPSDELRRLLTESDELVRLLTSIVKSAREKPAPQL